MPNFLVSSRRGNADGKRRPQDNDLNRKFRESSWNMVPRNAREIIKSVFISARVESDGALKLVVLQQKLLRVEPIEECVLLERDNEKGLLIYMETANGPKRFFTTIKRLADSVNDNHPSPKAMSRADRFAIYATA
jgi:hypothetical protein